MNDFKTSGCNPSHTGDSPYVWNVDSGGGLRFSDAILPYNVVLDCKDVTFRLNELDITLVESKMKEYLDNIDCGTRMKYHRRTVQSGMSQTIKTTIDIATQSEGKLRKLTPLVVLGFTIGLSVLFLFA